MRANWQRPTRLEWHATLGAYTIVVKANFDSHWRPLLLTSSTNTVALLVQADIHWAAAYMVGARSPVATVRPTDGSTWTVLHRGRTRSLECKLDTAIATALSRL